MGAGSQVQVECHEAMAEDAVDLFHPLYLQAFEPLRRLAVARHVLTRDELAAELLDPRVWKYVARQDGRPVALATLTADLATVPWVSPDYFAARYPQQSAEGRVFYLGFVLIAPDVQGGPVLRALLREMSVRAIAARAVVAYDICAYNDDAKDFSAATRSIMESMTEIEHEVIDVQTYYAMSFGPGRG